MEKSFEKILTDCRAIFEKKLRDYGPTWLIFRWISLVDQIFIKLSRLRALEESGGERRVADTPRDEYYGVINYCLVGLMKDESMLPPPEEILRNPAVLDNLPLDAILARYDAATARALSLMEQKNHDYGAAWQGMAVTSITDQMLVKVLRMKHILTSNRTLPAADSLPAQLMDILNYCLFALMLSKAGI